MCGRWIKLLGVAFAVCAFSNPSLGAIDRIVALVNDGAITASELTLSSEQIRQRNPGLSGESLRKAALEQLIMRAIQQQEATRLGITVDDATLDRGMEQLARQNRLSLSAFRKQAEAEGVSWASLRQSVRDEILVQRLRERAILGTITVNENEINEFLENNRRELSATQYALERFSVAYPRTDNAKSRATLERQVRRVMGLLRRGEPSETIRRTAQRETIPLDSGPLGWRTLEQLPSPLDEMTASLTPGGTSDPLPDGAGVHIFRLVEVREGKSIEITQTLARHILLKPNPIRDEEATRLQLLEFREHLAFGGSFSELAERHSEDYGSAVFGGELPWFGPGEMVPPFEEAASTLPPGNLSAPIQSQFGWHLIEVLDRKREDVSKDRLRAEARERIAQRKLLKETDRYMQRLRDEAFLEFPDAS